MVLRFVYSIAFTSFLTHSTFIRPFATAVEVKMQEEKQKPSEKDLELLSDAMVQFVYMELDIEMFVEWKVR